ncbi:hypothetical protein COV61_00210 [Candidatus Micrarchaeota archaeon CG11_big_fil_rev_8_21_14_0_20_47_5]|nr:MAG: hypothetical protein AUJ17_00380 [Candidatus Micrarchaeota archaeon CG1_02_47_40]PIN84413.1 MAG: hypothetical protein COV61_00210 [Candidatus Micrarchaeota archaeon CG11_big_fil_rev_8_21_14_0_20_47_5]
MDFSIDVAITLILFILPAYFANSTPVIFGGGEPLDFGKKFLDGRRLLGKGKTIRGFLSGVFAGMLIGVLEALILPYTPFNFFCNPSNYVVLAFFLSTGTMAGDSLGSFIKRRLAIPSGSPSLLLDQLAFLAIALFFAYPRASFLYALESLLFLFVLTYFLHVAFNVLANKLGLKRVPW